MNSTTAPDYVVIYVAAEETINTHVIYSLQPSLIVILYTETNRHVWKYQDRKEIGSKT